MLDSGCIWCCGSPSLVVLEVAACNNSCPRSHYTILADLAVLYVGLRSVILTGFTDTRAGDPPIHFEMQGILDTLRGDEDSVEAIVFDEELLSEL